MFSQCYIRTYIQVHMIKLQKCDRDEQQRKILKMTDFASPQHEESFPAVISRLVALDGMPFSLFITSKELHQSQQACGFDMPQSKKKHKKQIHDIFQQM